MIDSDADFRALMDKITQERGFRCSSYKDKCLRRRVAVRMRARGVASYDAYTRVLDADLQEYDRLVRVLTVNVTKFFRNWDTYSAIEQRVIPQLWERTDPKLRIWSAGCASGEEAYSLAILLHRHATATDTLARLKDVSIIATDIDAECLGDAERASYPEGALGDTPVSLQQKYLPQRDGRRTMLPEVKELVSFAHHDLLKTPLPFDDLHLIVCRNVIIYFEREAQDTLFREFHRTLAPGGFLVLGKVETLLGDSRALFSPVNARERIFRKL